ncbi:hypothetical protein MKX01_028139 [Papaver californicum]|nr:hypothetical protein MKX01_028139 [Papaver californicum]
MVYTVDQDQQWLLNCLTATLDTNHEVRSFAETSLNQASSQPGFGSALSKVAINRELPWGMLLLKQFIKKHWQEDDENFEHPVVQHEEKAVIRNLLLPSLDDPHGKVCTAVGMAVASIVQYDWPEDWPDLLPVLLKLMNDQTNISGVRGAMRCLALVAGDLDDTTVPSLVPVLFPCLYTIISSSQIYDKVLRVRALSIVYSCISVLGSMSGVYKTETSELVMSMIKPWIDQFCIILQAPVQFEDPDDWSIRTEALKCLSQFIQNFPTMEAEFSVIAGPLWQTFVSSCKVYEISFIRATHDSYEGLYDSDGEDKSLESFVIQLFEFLLTIMGSSRLAKVITWNVKELVYYTIAFLQMTDQQVDTWTYDANQYVADEDDSTYSCRVSGILLLDEIVASSGEGLEAMVIAGKERFSESQQEKAAGSAVWWRKREAAIYALACLSESLLEVQDSVSNRLGLESLLVQMLTEDMGTGVHEYPFLHARAFSAAAKFSAAITPRVNEQFLCAAITTVGLDVPPPVKIGACRALSQLLPEAEKSVLEPHMMNLFSSLMELLKHASDETLHLVLETLQAAVTAGHEALVSIEPIISPMILNMWALHVSDPFISIDAVEVLESVKTAPGCMRPLVSRVLPSIGPILEKSQQQPDGLAAGSLDLITMLLKNAPIDVVKAVYDVCFRHVIRIILQSDDNSEMQNATECLAAFVSGGRQEMLAWGGDPGSTMKSLLDAASRLLDPDMESSGSLFAGSYILQLILHLPSHMAQHIRDLIVALVRRMKTCQISGLKSSLLLIFARLVHLSAPNVEQFIDLLITLPAEGHDNCLAYVMSEWTKLQGEIQGSYQIKVTMTALALLLSTRHAELAKIQVQGYLIKTAGITTRSKAKLAPDQWTVMSLRAKIVSLLADMLIEIQEQALSGNDEDSDWEEVQDQDDLADQDQLYSVGTTVGGKPTTEQLNAMSKAFNENADDDGYADDVLIQSDPLNEINLACYISDFLLKFIETEGILFEHLFQNLTPAQQKAIQAVHNRARV